MNKARAFTLVEILIVVVLLGVLAVVVIPTAANSTTSAKDSALAADLQFNEKDTVEMLADGQALPANADDSHGWIYKAATYEIRADNTGTNLNGKPYYDF